MDYQSLFWTTNHYYGLPIIILDYQSLLWTTNHYYGLPIIIWTTIHYFGLPIIIMDYQSLLWTTNHYFGLPIIIWTTNLKFKYCHLIIFANGLHPDQTRQNAGPNQNTDVIWKNFLKSCFEEISKPPKKAWPFLRMWRDINAACYANNQHKLIHHSCMLEPSVVWWINRLPYKPGVTSLIPGFTGLSDETKLWPRPHMILAVGGT